MNILPPQAIAEALSWLATDAFNALQLPALAVVLGGPGEEELLHQFEMQCRDIDRASDSILILSLGTSKESPLMFNPVWRFQAHNDLARRIENIRMTPGHHFGTCWGSFSDAALRLLGLEPACLPAVYVRFACPGVADRPDPAVVVPLPHERCELASRFLTTLSWAASDHAHGHATLDTFLKEHTLHGWVVSQSTQNALDKALSGKSPRYEPAGCNPDEGETARVEMSWGIAVADADMQWGGLGEVVSEIEQFLNPWEYQPETTFRRPDLMVALRLARVAHNMGDYGTVVRNIGAAVEALFVASLLHLVRGSRRIRLPQHLDHVDPQAGHVEVAGVRLNHPRHVRIGAERGFDAPLLDPWLAPPLKQGLGALEYWLGEQSLTVAPSAFAAIVELHRRIADLRNPAAHGEQINREQAEEMWRLLEMLILSGQAAAMVSVRRGFYKWPDVDWTVLSGIRADPRPHYEQSLRAVSEAHQESEVWDCRRKSDHERVAALRAALNHFSSLAQSPVLNPVDLASLSAVKDAHRHMEGWEAFQADVAALSECDRQAGFLARVAGRWFTTHSRGDRHHLAEVSRALTPSPKTIRSTADIDGVIARIEHLLKAGIVVAAPGRNWQENVRRRLERWLDSVRLRDIASARTTPAAVWEKIRKWRDSLTAVLQQAEGDLKAVEVQYAEVARFLDCARARLAATRAGLAASCVCGRHSKP